MSNANGTLHLTATTSTDYKLMEENRTGVAWLVARNFTARFAGRLSLPGVEMQITGVYLCVENAMLPVNDSEILGYSHGVVTIYNPIQIEIFSGPYLKSLEGMRWENGEIADSWTQVVGTWSGMRDFAGRLLHVNLQGAWQEGRMVETGNVVLI